MKRCYYDATAISFLATASTSILNTLVEEQRGIVEPMQRIAWEFEIDHLKVVLSSFPTAHVFLEFTIPRMGRRVDAIILLNSTVFVLEYKVGKDSFTTHDIHQTVGYALDLNYFHETSHDLTIVPVLVATKATAIHRVDRYSADSVRPIELTNEGGLHEVLAFHFHRHPLRTIDASTWIEGRYKPTPTIVEAAQALYRGHDVKEISRSEAGATNLSNTCDYINAVINQSREQGAKSICFVTGVPGSGKTLAGLNIANSRMDADRDNHAVFLSGNGPLVEVLRAALTNDAMAQRQATSLPRQSKPDIERKTHAFIQNIHHFRDESLKSTLPPVDRIVVFDEAQRAWDLKQTSRFMQRKRAHPDFSMSEAEFLLSVMDRHDGWATVVCLVGGGQEINTGEAGIAEWLNALKDKFPRWRVHLSPQIAQEDYVGPEAAASALKNTSISESSALHLSVSLRSFRAEALSDFVGALVNSDIERARQLRKSLVNYPLFVTRSLSEARSWLRRQRRGLERSGLLASSNALRLKPEGVFVKAEIDPCKWFLAPADDIRSSIALEDAASEFDVQGLELDWACICWDGNLRRDNDIWEPHNFAGTKWQRVRQPEDRKYVLNSYRVLLTRARQGMVIFVPKGDANDLTRLPSIYDPIYNFLISAGVTALRSADERAHDADLPSETYLQEVI